ncbi:DUF4340 domain-containing protein [Pontiellaceae bacterium B12227]|nr:DUF4340 domain-containing protein [Pontiellaceae bacterium B12227]
MKGRSTLIILFCIMVLGVFIWVQESMRANKPSRTAERVRLFNLDAHTLISIEFRHSNQVVRCVKENGIWMAGDRDGNTGRADEALIHRMVSGLNSMGKGTTITGQQLSIRGMDSAEYGFSDPAISIAAVDNQGRHTWLVGRKTPLGDMVYAKSGEAEDIYTVSDKLLVVVPDSPDLLRDRILFPGEAAGVRRVEIRGSAGFVQLVKDPHEGWRMQQPVSAQADVKEVDLFIEKLYLLRIEDFVADNVSDFSVYGLQGETRQISLGHTDGTSRMLVIGDDIADQPGFVYARRADDTSVFSLSADILQLLNVPTDRFRDAGVLAVPPGSISSIHITHGGDQLGMAYDVAKGWNITSPMVWEADPQQISDFVTLWVSAVITEFDVVTNSIPAEWSIEFGSVEQGTTNRLEILPTNGSREGLLIRRDDDPAVYRINLPLVPDSIIDPLVYKNRTVWTLDPEQVNIVALQKGNIERQVVERLEDQNFAPVGTNGNVRLNKAAMAKMLRRIARVDTSGYITYNPRDLDIYGLASPLAELHIGLSDSNQLGRVLLIGRETPDGFYTMVKGRDVVFYLEKPVVNLLTADLLQETNPVVPVVE